MSKTIVKTILVSFKKNRYVLGHLSYNLENEELSYYLAYPDGPKRHMMKRNRKPLSGLAEPLHHYTWHRNKMHAKDGNDKILFEYTYQQGLLIVGNDLITPLLLQTFKLDHQHCCIPLENDFIYPNPSTNHLIFDVEDHGYFSACLFLAPTHLSNEEVLKCLWHDLINPQGIIFERTYLFNICKSLNDLIRIKAWDKYDLLITCSPYFQIPTEQIPSFIKSYRIPNEFNIQEGLKELIIRCQATEIAQSILSLLDLRIQINSIAKN